MNPFSIVDSTGSYTFSLSPDSFSNSNYFSPSLYGINVQCTSVNGFSFNIATMEFFALIYKKIQQKEKKKNKKKGTAVCSEKDFQSSIHVIRMISDPLMIKDETKHQRYVSSEFNRRYTVDGTIGVGFFSSSLRGKECIFFLLL